MADTEEPQGATSAQLAGLFDCTTRQIELWAKAGICVRKGRGRYDAAMSTRNVVRHLREQAAGRAGIDRDTDVVAANKARSEEQAALMRTKRMQLEGTLVAVDAVRETWGRVLRGLRQAVLKLPASIAFEVPSLTPHDVKTVKRLAHDLLEDAGLGKHVEGVNGDAADEPVSDRAPGGRGAGVAGAAAAGLAGGMG